MTGVPARDAGDVERLRERFDELLAERDELKRRMVMDARYTVSQHNARVDAERDLARARAEAEEAKQRAAAAEAERDALQRAVDAVRLALHVDDDEPIIEDGKRCACGEEGWDYAVDHCRDLARAALAAAGAPQEGTQR